MKNNHKNLRGLFLVIVLIITSNIAFALPITGRVIEISPSQTTITRNTCPQLPPPAPNWCSGGTIIPGTIDSNGCRGPPSCEKLPTTCPSPVCPEGTTQYDTGKLDATDCKVYSCITTQTCQVPSCKQGMTAYDTGEKDTNGCAIYSCSSQSCIDSDGGEKIYYKGATSKLTKVETDTCTDCVADCAEGKVCEDGCLGVVEYYCQDEQIVSAKYKCPNGCVEGACVKNSKPYCTAIGTRSEGWSIEKNGLNNWANCANCTAECKEVGTKSEGWYSSCDNSLITYDICGTTQTCSIPVCKDGSEPYDTGTKDANGCSVYACPPQACPENCICDEKTTTCPTSLKKPVEMEISTSEGVSSISVEKISNNSISIKQGSTSIRTSKKLVIEEKKLLMETSQGNKEIKIMPSTASETAINQLKLKEFEIELKDTGKPVYEIVGKRDVKLIGLIKTEMLVTSQINAETGDIEKTVMPWWSFLAK